MPESVDAVAFSARGAAVFLRTTPTLMGINPVVGMPAAILTFLPRYPLVTADHGARYHDKLRGFPGQRRLVRSTAGPRPAGPPIVIAAGKPKAMRLGARVRRRVG